MQYVSISLNTCLNHNYRPFAVSCTNHTLEKNASTQIHIEFQPMQVGDHQRELVVHYDTGS